MKHRFLPGIPWFGPALIAALLGGCFGEDAPPPGQVDVDKLWTAWQSDGWNPIFREYPGKLAAENYRRIKTTLENPGDGSSYTLSWVCDVYVCAATGDDTCFHAKSYPVNPGNNSIDFSGFMDLDDRPIVQLTDASLIYKKGSIMVKMVPCRKVLATRSGDSVKVDWPGPKP